MSKERENILFPVGRMVQGSLYEPKTTDAENKPLVIKTGTKAGQPRVDYYFAYAIPKGTEQHWLHTEWGKKIYEFTLRQFTKGEPNRQDFAWKIKDGDSQIPNSKGMKDCDREGYPGHWVLNFTGMLAPSLVNADGTPFTLPANSINCGDYVQVHGNIISNGSAMNPGIFLNHIHVAFIGYGKRIIFITVDPKTLAWSKQLPAGASATPVSQQDTFESAHPIDTTLGNVPTPTSRFTPEPYPQILTPPPGIVPPVVMPVPTAPAIAVPSPKPKKTMTPKANGTYEQFLAAGWTDAQMIQEGYLVA